MSKKVKSVWVGPHCADNVDQAAHFLEHSPYIRALREFLHREKDRELDSLVRGIPAVEGSFGGDWALSAAASGGSVRTINMILSLLDVTQDGKSVLERD